MARGFGRGSLSGGRGSRRGASSISINELVSPTPPVLPQATTSSEVAVALEQTTNDHPPAPVAPNVPPRSNMNNRSVITLQNGKVHFVYSHSHYISSTIKHKLDIEGHNWKSVTPISKDYYWEEFKKKYQWDQNIEVDVKEAWEKKAATLYSSMLARFRQKLMMGQRPREVKESIWDAWVPRWRTQEFIEKSATASRNSCSETEGEGTGPSRHTGGSKSHIEHTRELKETLGRDPYPHEILEKTHMRKGDGNFVDNKSKQIFDRVVARYESEVSAVASDSSMEESVDANKIYFQEVGGMKKKRIYGIGSVATSYYFLNASNATCSSHYLPEEHGEPASNNLQSTMEQLKSELNAERESRKQTENALLQRVEENELKFQEFVHTFSSSAAHSATGSVDLSTDDV